MNSIESTASEQLHRGLAYYLIEAVYAVILVVTILGWLVAGFAVWVPLLIRSTTMFAAAVLYASLYGDQKRVDNAKGIVYYAVRFYLRGFQHFVDFYRERHSPASQESVFEPLSEKKWMELLVDCLWVLGVWTALYFVTHPLLAALYVRIFP
jgi:hypothetical protein